MFLNDSLVLKVIFLIGGAVDLTITELKGKLWLSRDEINAVNRKQRNFKMICI